MIIKKMVEYKINEKGDEANKVTGQMFEYLLAENGVFIQAERPGLKALFKIGEANIRGLKPLSPYLEIEKVPTYIVGQMLQYGNITYPNEWLGYLSKGESPWKWELTAPKQEAGYDFVVPDSAERIGKLIEVHTHPNWPTKFSSRDNRDEAMGVRVFTIIGNPKSEFPTIITRVGIYGYFWEVPSSWVYELPPNIVDVLGDKQIEKNQTTTTLRDIWERIMSS